MVPKYLFGTLRTTEVMKKMQQQQTEEEENSQVDNDHVVLRIASCFDGSSAAALAGETPETRIALRDSASCCSSSSFSTVGRSRQANNLLQSLTSYYLFYLVGVTSIFIPFITGQGALHMLPWLLSLSGFFSLLQYACLRHAPGSIAIFFLAILHLTTGLWMLSKPAVVGQTAITHLIEAWFLVHGTLKLWISLQVRKLATWPALFASGLLSIFLACVLHGLVPDLGLPLIDSYIRIELLFTGCAGALLLYSIIVFVHNQRPCE